MTTHPAGFVSFSSQVRRAMVMLAFLIPTVGGATTVEEDMVWTGGLRQALFGDRAITESDELIVLDVPARAEDAAIVPVSITAQVPQTDERYIKTIYLLIDKNPGPLAATFRFTQASGRADLAFRVRVNAYSPVRAIAETNNGELFMSRRFIKASGGCSAPAASDLDAAMARLGRIKLKTGDVARTAHPNSVQLMISHPNLSGLQMDQLTQLYAPAHFVRQIKVSFDDEEVFSADTSFAISENPSFKFFFVPDRAGELTAEVSDTKNQFFSQTLQVHTEGDKELVAN
ncbi:MAG: quinoprotein dehydrogenase-associated SoxYZ-like carrier [Gammaproteobacteria bacterium]|nr:quinoprotein dehydrogenase-associated SoxYZ-like carrier [Gammaproteobacteria bacterium]MDH4313976.1 quinoprotein dehydrogenase-associated SoxYZ-like carrier [Gammaproteobacteria bacterium]MDH5212710.1 quinoprotein dehydrogenase-associated SoxYZ-like carrier [Gammaproteobacteria bacterium]MDH5500239.1 quinoprotein dehydrogenase-associated SoxYZ-like carrier [Gammaproteobacteria bacterium]